MLNGVEALMKCIPNVGDGGDPCVLINGLVNMATKSIGPKGCCPQKDNKNTMCCCKNCGGPEEIVHLPGKSATSLCNADPRAVVDALFPPLSKTRPIDAMTKAANAGHSG